MDISSYNLQTLAAKKTRKWQQKLSINGGMTISQAISEMDLTHGRRPRTSRKNKGSFARADENEAPSAPAEGGPSLSIIPEKKHRRKN